MNNIVSEHNATIRVEDNLPSGARFTVEIPVIIEPDEPKPAAPDDPKAALDPMVVRP